MADEDEKLDNEDLNPEENESDQEESGDESAFGDKVVDENIIPVGGLYENWFLDYASYVILERAVPSLYDGFKPVQRRIMHSMKEMDDGRYNKVANIIGNTMKYHPHGDASIGDAPMIRITRFDKDKADESIAKIEAEMESSSQQEK